MFWLFPVSLLVGLVSIQNISIFLPGLVRLLIVLRYEYEHTNVYFDVFQKSYLDKHPWEEELIQSFLPTLLGNSDCEFYTASFANPHVS